jgi:hypothetical protein
MQVSDLIRYGLWCGIIVTADGNRRQYGMKTTWLPHLLMNSITLLLPDAYRRLAVLEPEEPQPASLPDELRQIAHRTVTAMVCNNPHYVTYVAPLAFGYLLSSPWFNIYKGRLADIKIAGFGLDALPHTTTAFALCALVCDTVRAAAESATSPVLRSALRWSNDHYALVSAIALALATLVWEYGEYHIYQHEMQQRGSREHINMQWSLSDALHDCAANTIGWAAAMVWRRVGEGVKG